MAKSQQERSQRDPAEAEEAARQAEPTTEVVAGQEPGQGDLADPETQEQAEKDQAAREGERAETDSADGEHVTGQRSRTTTLDSDVSMPGYVAPGDGPHDTVVATEHASSATPDKANAAQQGFGVVNAVVPIPDPSGRAAAVARAQEEAGSRVEEYEVPGPTGLPVRVRHDLDTGATEVVG